MHEASLAHEAILDEPARTQPPARKAGEVKGYTQARVLDVRHWTGKLFSFRVTRDPAFRFEAGQFVMIGLLVDGKPLVRAYSIVSAPYDEHLEFFSIKVPNGPLTSRLQHIAPGDTVLVGRKPTGTLLIESLEPGRRLYLLATGTGFAPFGSILRNPDTYERFEEIVLVYGCREAAELAFATETVIGVRESEFLGEVAEKQLVYYTTVTREAYYHRGRVTDILASGKLFADLAAPPLDPAQDRVMICGNPGMLADLKAMLLARGFKEGSSGEPASYVIEKAFAER
ncbi:MAG: ferredoxin--NADP reductase [Hyphomicrobiaceae bacterium]|nr:ferredoxin--NADP reductase [Hyphomicrobiaceae bacterium]